jgi:hypothetical protein
MRERRPGRLRRAWRAVRRFLGRSQPPPEPPWLDDEPDLVPVGPPRRPRPAASAAVEPPTEPDPLVYPTQTDAVGREDEDDEAEGGLRAAL